MAEHEPQQNPDRPSESETAGLTRIPLPTFVAEVETKLKDLYKDKETIVASSLVILPTVIAMVMAQLPEVERDLKKKYGINPEALYQLLCKHNQEAQAETIRNTIEQVDQNKAVQRAEGEYAVPLLDLERVYEPEGQAYLQQWKNDIRKEMLERLAFNDNSPITATQNFLDLLASIGPLEHIAVNIYNNRIEREARETGQGPPETHVEKLGKRQDMPEPSCPPQKKPRDDRGKENGGAAVGA